MQMFRQAVRSQWLDCLAPIENERNFFPRTQKAWPVRESNQGLGTFRSLA